MFSYKVRLTFTERKRVASYWYAIFLSYYATKKAIEETLRRGLRIRASVATYNMLLVLSFRDTLFKVKITQKSPLNSRMELVVQNGIITDNREVRCRRERVNMPIQPCEERSEIINMQLHDMHDCCERRSNTNFHHISCTHHRKI